MRRTHASLGLLLLTAVLSGCVSYGGGYSPPPEPYPGWWIGAWGGALAAVLLLILVVVVLAAVAVVGLTLVAVVARGPAAQVAGAFLVVIGAFVIVEALSTYSMLGLLVGAGLGAVGLAALLPPRPATVRTAVLSEGKP